jgi:hypothetical protein
MKSLEELGNYYNTALMPELIKLEEQRKQVLKKVCLVNGIAIAVFAAILILLFVMKVPMQHIFLGVFIAGAAIIGIYKWLTNEYVNNFKSGVIENIVHFIDSNLKYARDAYVPSSDFIKSKIFNRHPDRHRGDDYVSGVVGKTKIEFSEIHSEYETRDSKGRSSWHTIFKGLFFIGDFNKHFKGITIVLPDTAERLFGGFGNFLQKINASRGQLIKLEDPEFEKEFVVYGDDQVEARYILSTSLMKRIVDFKKKTKRRVFLSFVGSKIYVAIAFAKDLFEPRVFQTLIDFSQVVEYYQDLELVIGLVEDLNLNLRIWTKE